MDGHVRLDAVESGEFAARHDDPRPRAECPQRALDLFAARVADAHPRPIGRGDQAPGRQRPPQRSRQHAHTVEAKPVKALEHRTHDALVLEDLQLQRVRVDHHRSVKRPEGSLADEVERSAANPTEIGLAGFDVADQIDLGVARPPLTPAVLEADPQAPAVRGPSTFSAKTSSSSGSLFTLASVSVVARPAAGRVRLVATRAVRRGRVARARHECEGDSHEAERGTTHVSDRTAGAAPSATEEALQSPAKPRVNPGEMAGAPGGPDERAGLASPPCPPHTSYRSRRPQRRMLSVAPLPPGGRGGHTARDRSRSGFGAGTARALCRRFTGARQHRSRHQREDRLRPGLSQLRRHDQSRWVGRAPDRTRPRARPATPGRRTAARSSATSGAKMGSSPPRRTRTGPTSRF